MKLYNQLVERLQSLEFVKGLIEMCDQQIKDLKAALQRVINERQDLIRQRVEIENDIERIRRKREGR